MERKKIGVCIVLTVLVVVGIIKISGIQSKEQEKESLKPGKQQLEAFRNRDVALIEKEIEKLESKEKKKEIESDDFSAMKAFRNAVVVGDSITESLEEYQVLKSENVVAKIGASLHQSEALIQKAIGLNKKKVFLAFGMNDMAETRGDEKLFCKRYKAVIDKFKKELPESDIYINSILPVQEKAIRKQKENGKYEKFNQALKKMCEEEKIVFIDNTDLVTKELFEPDGIHMKLPYYKLWTKRMAQIGGL